MKRKYLFLAIAALLAVVGLWLARTAQHSDDSARQKSNMDAASKMPSDGPESGQMLRPSKSGHTLAPPIPNRRFTDFTPEQRVEFARKGHGPGG